MEQKIQDDKKLMGESFFYIEKEVKNNEFSITKDAY